jgi:hypothetical protein
MTPATIRGGARRRRPRCRRRRQRRRRLRARRRRGPRPGRQVSPAVVRAPSARSRARRHAGIPVPVRPGARRAVFPVRVETEALQRRVGGAADRAAAVPAIPARLDLRLAPRRDRAAPVQDRVQRDPAEERQVARGRRRRAVRDVFRRRAGRRGLLPRDETRAGAVRVPRREKAHDVERPQRSDQGERAHAVARRLGIEARAARREPRRRPKPAPDHHRRIPQTENARPGRRHGNGDGRAPAAAQLSDHDGRRRSRLAVRRSARLRCKVLDGVFIDETFSRSSRTPTPTTTGSTSAPGRRRTRTGTSRSIPTICGRSRRRRATCRAPRRSSNRSG